MEMIIVKPKDEKEAQEVLAVLKKMKVKAEVQPAETADEDRPRTKEEILDSIEKGIKEAIRHSKGEIKLRDARELLDDL
jgi:hypothetical protein